MSPPRLVHAGTGARAVAPPHALVTLGRGEQHVVSGVVHLRRDSILAYAAAGIGECRYRRGPAVAPVDTVLETAGVQLAVPEKYRVRSLVMTPDVGPRWRCPRVRAPPHASTRNSSEQRVGGRVARNRMHHLATRDAQDAGPVRSLGSAARGLSHRIAPTPPA